MLLVEIGDLNPWLFWRPWIGGFELNWNLHVDGMLHANDKVGEGAVAWRELAYFSERSRGTGCVGHDNECLGETRYHQKRKGGCGRLTVLVLHKPSSLYHRGVRLGWYQKRLVLDDGSKVGQVFLELHYPSPRNF